jgi:hypothetical protein
MATADQTQTSDSTDVETSLSTLLAECDTAEEIKALDGKTLDRTVVDGGDRVRRTHCQIISEPQDLCRVETGDIIIRLCGGRSSKITDIGDDISDINGLHVVEKIPDADEDPQVSHVSILWSALEDDAYLIAGTRTGEHANVERRFDQ